MEQRLLNDFKRTYFDLTKPIRQGDICHDPKTTMEHRRIVSEVCEWAIQQGLTFFTRVYLKGGEIADICIPELPRPFIEIRHSEKGKSKEYLSAYDDLRIFIDTDDPYKLR